MDYVVTDDDKEYIRTYVAEAADDQSKKDRRKECASIFGLSLSQVAAITAHTVIRANRANKALPVDAVPVEVAMPAGTAMDYDNPIKQKYRSTLKNFIEKTYPTIEERRNKKVLCLPGRKCLEPKIYLDMGFQAENIVGVEGEPSAYREFLSHASQLGISVRTCDLEKVVSEMEWDVINLDFCGPIQQKVLDLLSDLRLNPKGKCFLGLNLMGQRESEAAQSILDQYYATAAVSKDIAASCQESFIDSLEAQNNFRELNRQKREAGERLSDADISEQRDVAIPLAVFHKAGKYHSPLNRVSPAPNLPEMLRNDAVIHLLTNVFFRIFWREMAFCHGVDLEQSAAISHKIMLLFEIAMAPRHICIGGAQHSYISPSHQKYLVDFYVMELARPYGTACDEIIMFVNNSFEALVEVIESLKDDKTREQRSNMWYFQVRSRGGIARKGGNGVTNSDTIEFVVQGKVVSRLRVRAMFAGLDRMSEVLAKDINIQISKNLFKYERTAL